MHPEAKRFVEEFARDKKFRRVIEFGSRDVNGSIKDCFATEGYHGIDIVDGEGVDEVADAAEWRTDDPGDCVVCCEVLEHLPNLEDIVHSAYEALVVNGWLIITCAAYPREPHSAIDGGALRPYEYYGNVAPHELEMVCLDVGFDIWDCRLYRSRGDLYLVARKT